MRAGWRGIRIWSDRAPSAASHLPASPALTTTTASASFLAQRGISKFQASSGVEIARFARHDIALAMRLSSRAPRPKFWKGAANDVFEKAEKRSDGLGFAATPQTHEID